MVTGFLKLNGMTVGVVANRTEIIGEDEKVAKKYDAVLSCNGYIYFWNCGVCKGIG